MVHDYPDVTDVPGQDLFHDYRRRYLTGGEYGIGIIPEDKSVREALTRKDAVVYTHPKSKASVAYKMLAAGLIGRKYEPEVSEDSWLFKVLKKIRLR